MKFNLVGPEEFHCGTRWNASYFVSEFVQYHASDGFELLTVGDLCNERREFLLPTDHPARTFNYVGLENVSQMTRMLVGFAPKKGAKVKSRSKVFREGDILYGRLRPGLNKCLLVDKSLSEGICSTEIFVLVPNEEVVAPEYLGELLVSAEVSSRIQGLVAGAALPRVQIKDLLDIRVPVPGREDQERIVSKLVSAREDLRQHIQRASQLPAEIAGAFSAYAFGRGGGAFEISATVSGDLDEWRNALPEGVRASRPRRGPTRT